MTESVLIERLRSILGPGAVLTERYDIEPYSHDWRRVFHGRPACVVRPASTVEACLMMQACHALGAAIVPHGGNTGMAGGASPDASGTQVVVSLARMKEIRALDPIGMTVEVEAGAILQTVKEAVANAGRFLPISIPSEGSATIGGVVSTNAGGMNVVRYGMTRGLTLGLEVVMADGTVLPGLRHLRKDNAGYDWRQLFIGSEGTLGLVTAAVLRLMPRPRHRVTALLSVPDISAAISLFELATTEIGEAVSVFELISGSAMALVEKHNGVASPIASGDWLILIEATSSLSGLKAAAEALLEAGYEKGLVLDGVVAATDTQAAALWMLREGLSAAESSEGASVKHDISIPLPAIPRFVDDVEKALVDVAPGARLNIFGHLGDGNLHTNVLLAAGNDAHRINMAVHDVVARLNGSISAEHGIGQYRVAELRRLRDAAELDVMAKLKSVLDPAGQLNPGKVL